MSTGRLIPLDESHRATVMTLRERAEQWLSAKGLEQYNGSNSAKARSDLDAELSAGLMVGWEVDGRVVAVAAIKPADRDFWTDEEASDPRASWIGRFMVADGGKGWGEDLLEAIADTERARGKKCLRLDCWKTNTALHDYYLRRGFHHVRTANVPGRMSGALFERPI